MKKITSRRNRRPRFKESNQTAQSVWLRLLLIVFNIFILSILASQLFKQSRSFTNQCYHRQSFPLDNRDVAGSPLLYGNIQDTLEANVNHCFYFEVKEGQKVRVDHTVPIKIISTSDEGAVNKDSGTYNFESSSDNRYQIYVLGGRETTDYQIQVAIFESSTNAQEIDKLTPAASNNLSSLNSNEVARQLSREGVFSYNIQQPPPFQPSPTLGQIVSDAVSIAASRGISSDSISISLIDLKQSLPGSQIPVAEHNGALPRYPASIVKLFWMAVLYSQYQAGIVPEGAISEQDVHAMIFDSDNEPASRVLDLITDTTSGDNLPEEELQQWVYKRESVNRFFESAGYLNVNISQKTFPIPYLNLNEPTGRERQMRGDSPPPLRNYLTASNVSRLLFEIAAHQSVSPDYSKRMLKHLERDLNPNAWRQVPFNSIEGFLGETLPPDAYLASKAGWTSDTRHDAAIISSPDRTAHYILVVFGEGEQVADDEEILPLISKMVYQNMTSR